MIVAGLGFTSAATADDLAAALAEAESRTGQRAQALATAAPKAAAPALTTLAAARGLPVLPALVTGVATPTQSPASLAAHGTGSVAEASALTAAGPGARLLAPRIATSAATCALARAHHSCPNIPGQSRRDGGSDPAEETP